MSSSHSEKEALMKHIVVLLVCVALLAAAAIERSAQAQSTPSNSPNTVTAGTRFLVGLGDTLNTKDAKTGDRFHTRTLEPLTTTDGFVLGPGMEIRGHVDKVETAHQTGRARMWLTFDDIKTRSGWFPLVADLTDIPGVHSVKVDYDREGEIEARTSKRQEEAEAAAAGAFAGAAAGVLAHNGRGAAMGAAAGAATGFMVASGLGQELTLAKNTKLELILDRPLYVGR
jgi:hypothetical protein